MRGYICTSICSIIYYLPSSATVCKKGLPGKVFVGILGMTPQITFDVNNEADLPYVLTVTKSLISAGRVLVIAGAGISTSSGIPVNLCVSCLCYGLLLFQDFRSLNGLYKTVGKDIFQA